MSQFTEAVRKRLEEECDERDRGGIADADLTSDIRAALNEIDRLTAECEVRRVEHIETCKRVDERDARIAALESVLEHADALAGSCFSSSYDQVYSEGYLSDYLEARKAVQR